MPNSITQNRFISEALEAHNKYRKHHGVQALELDPKLVELALNWAEYLSSMEKLKYKNQYYLNEPLGENILRYKLENKFYIEGQKVTDIWYSEENDYRYNGEFSPNTGHFTQIVWKSTKKVGFGFAIDDNGFMTVVSFYYPAGNYKNFFNENVLPSVDRQNQIHKKKNEFLTDFFGMEQKKSENKIDLTNKLNLNENFEKQQVKFIEEALRKHNECRRKHGVEALEHNSDLSKIAQDYANKLAKMNVLKHSINAKYRNEPIGENLAYFYDSRDDFVYSGETATMQWYEEIKKHNFNLDNQPGTGHFTQLIWKNTKEVGFGVAKAADKSFYAVANYYPIGNIIGRYVQNVPRPF